MISNRKVKKYDYEKSPQGIKHDNNQLNIDYIFLFKLISKLLRTQSLVKILEIGAGGGRNLQAIHNQFGNKVELFGTDISHTAVSYAQSLKIGHFYQVKSDVVPINKKFDLILFVDIFEHLETISLVRKTLDNASKHLKKNGCLYISVPIELNPFSVTSFFSKLPYLRNLTKIYFGHLIQFDIDLFMRLIDRKRFNLEDTFFSVHYLTQIQTVFFFFLPKMLLSTFFSEEASVSLRDSSEIIGGGKHVFLSFIKRLFLIISRPFSYMAFKESEIRSRSSFGVEKMHLLLTRNHNKYKD